MHKKLTDTLLKKSILTYVGLIIGIIAGILLTDAPLCYATASDTTGTYGTVYTNPETDYRVVIEDDAGLLTDTQLIELATTMQDITKYGNAAFKTVDTNNSSAESFARSYYQEQFRTKSGTLFLIDMDNRKIWIHSDGAIYKVITKDYANTITDNVYRYASNGDYFSCANNAFQQIFTLLQGDKIAQPMKYTSNAFLAIILALLLNFGIVCYFTRIRKPFKGEIVDSLQLKLEYTKPVATFLHQTKVYDPVESNSGSSSGGSSGGGGGGGGGGSSSSGGGGGHSF